VEQGWVWIFAAVEHWNAECVGWHVAKTGDRYAALEPIAMGLRNVFGSIEAEAARGLGLRMDHGTQYLSDNFRVQVRWWGIRPSWAFVEEPQTNGVVERFNRTLKEQAIHGRVFRDVEEVRAAVAAFVERYNCEWLVEKLGFVSPRRARELHELRRVA
jgi:putative transposase